MDKRIPRGDYCYTLVSVDDKGRQSIIPCPFWGRSKEHPDQENGYCTKHWIRDWEDNTNLWDMVKECGENLDEPNS